MQKGRKEERDCNVLVFPGVSKVFRGCRREGGKRSGISGSGSVEAIRKRPENLIDGAESEKARETRTKDERAT